MLRVLNNEQINEMDQKETATKAAIFSHRPLSRKDVREETTTMRLIIKPASNGMPIVNMTPRYLPRRTLCRGTDPTSIRPNVPACFSPQMLS